MTRPKAKTANRQAADKFITELRRLGRLEQIDVARVRILRGIADALDDDSQNAQMWRQFREAVEGMLRQDENANDGLEQALAELRRAPVGHSETT